MLLTKLSPLGVNELEHLGVDGIFFFCEYEDYIMGIYSQYASMFENLLDSEECAMLTLLYLMFGEDGEVPDRYFKLPTEDPDVFTQYIQENNFLVDLYESIYLAATLHQLSSSKLIRVVRDKTTGKKLYSLTEKGKKHGECLIKKTGLPTQL